MRLALDTNRYSDFSRGDSHLVPLLEQSEAVFLPFVVVAELTAGFALGRQGQRNTQKLRAFLSRPGISTLFPTAATLGVYASLWRQLRLQGTPIPTNDLWIAALVVEHDLTLVTRDSHFQNLPQILTL